MKGLECVLVFAVNPYHTKDRIDDKVVKEFYKDYWNVQDDEVVKTGML